MSTEELIVERRKLRDRERLQSLYTQLGDAWVRLSQDNRSNWEHYLDTNDIKRIDAEILELKGRL